MVFRCFNLVFFFPVKSNSSVEGDAVEFDDNTNGRVRVPLEGIVKANLEIDVEEEFRLAAEREKQAAAAKSNGRKN